MNINKKNRCGLMIMVVFFEISLYLITFFLKDASLKNKNEITLLQ